MDEICLRGDHYAMGREYGRRLARARFAPPAALSAKIAFAEACALAVARHAPELLDELRGVVDGGTLDAGALQAFALTLGEGPACSVVAISGAHTADGKPLFGRNFDFFEWDLPYQELYRTYPTGGLASLGSTDVLIGREDGLNEAGLAIAQTHVSSHGYEPGVLFSLAGRMILDRCRTVPEAVALLGAIPHVRANNWLLMDAGGTIATVETSPRGTAATYATDGFAIVTNQFRHPAMREYEAIAARPPDSEARLCALQEWWDGRVGAVTAADLRAVLSRHEGGVCVHRTDLATPLSTLRSLVMSPGDRWADVAAGAPCRTPYERFAF